jgi:hypothetical protein
MLATLDLRMILSPFKFVEPYIVNKTEFNVIDYSEKKQKTLAKTKEDEISFPFDLSDYGSMKELVDAVNRLLINGKKELLKLSPKQAALMLEDKELKKVLELLPTFDTLLFELEEPPTILESNMIISFRGFVTNIIDIISLLDDIANRETIDEKSDDYLDFLSNLTDIGLKSKRMATGNSLRELM